jgi:aminoglycoside phosphotransferase (APT) family kinase protein
MNSRPWETDRALTLETARTVIGTCFPAVDSDGLRHIGSGWEFDAFLTRDDWVFRFPRRAHYADLFEPEKPVHRLLAGALPSSIAIPRVELMGHPTAEFPYRFAGHRFIPGVAVDAVDPGLMPTVAREIGAALGAVHAIPEQASRAAGVVEMDADDDGRKAWLERGLRLASELRGLDPVVDDALGWASGLSLPPGRQEEPLRFIHHDLSPEHLIIDPRTGRLAGIIDWTDAILGDPARDFVGLVTSQGWGFAEEILRSYPHPIDRAFRERLGFMARLLSLIWLAEASEQGTDVARLTRWVHNAFATGSDVR